LQIKKVTEGNLGEEGKAPQPLYLLLSADAGQIPCYFYKEFHSLAVICRPTMDSASLIIIRS
jgi:hypothetical protein